MLISVVLMEAILMLPLTYRQLGDAFTRRLVQTVRAVGLPAAVTGVLAWLIGRGGGPLYAFIAAHGRILGLTVVAAAGVVLMVVFYSVPPAVSALGPTTAGLRTGSVHVGRYGRPAAIEAVLGSVDGRPQPTRRAQRGDRPGGGESVFPERAGLPHVELGADHALFTKVRARLLLAWTFKDVITLTRV